MHDAYQGRPAPQRPAPKPTPAPASPGAFSPLDLRDRVVIMALFYEIVQVDQVERAWRQWRKLRAEGSETSLWHVLVRKADIDREALYEVAAQIYGFEEADINRLRAQTLIREVSTTFTQEQWQCLCELLVAPIALGEDPRTGHARLVFATYDPTRPEVTRLLQSFNLNSFELRYAPAAVITDLFSELLGPEVKALLLQHTAPPSAPVRQPDPVASPALGATPEAPADDAPPRPPADLDPTSLVDWFESVLIATYQAGATEAHIFLNAAHELEILFYADGAVCLQRKEDTFHPEGLLAYIMDDVIKVAQFDPDVPMEISFQRWIDRHLTRFHISIQPSADSQERNAATIVIRVLGHREASAEGMGPWRAQ